MSIIDSLVTNRTAEDKTRVEELTAKGLAGMTAEELEFYLHGASEALEALDGPLEASDGPLYAYDGVVRGAYRAGDWNRVVAAVDYVAGRLQSCGNAVEVYPGKEWTNGDTPDASDMRRYLDNVAALRAVLAVLPTTPDVPPDMEGLTYQEANNIEQILKDIDHLITNMTAAWLYSGDLYAGEV